MGGHICPGAAHEGVLGALKALQVAPAVHTYTNTSQKQIDVQELGRTILQSVCAWG